VQAVFLAVPASVQLLFFFHAVSGRGYALHPVLLLCAFTIRHLALPFLGVEAANAIAASIRATLKAQHIPILAVVLPPVVGLSLLAALLRQRTAPALWLVSAGALIAVVSYAGAIGGVASLLLDVRGGGRYVVVPQSLFCLSVLAVATAAKDAVTYVAWAVIIWLVCVGGWMFVTPSTIESHGPLWRNEVAAWNIDPHHVLHVWPESWTVTLDPQHVRR
jgi:hypothetical protein